MTALYELSKELVAVQDLANDPDIPPEALRDTLEGLELEFNEKARRIIHVCKNNNSVVDAIDAEIGAMQKRKKAYQAAEARLKDYLRENMEASGITKIECTEFVITLAKGRDVAIVDLPDDLPDEYVSVKTTIQPIKADILKALKEGVDVPGAHIEKTKSSVRIR